MGMKNKISTSAPGRICLFGEHQDNLKLPVIPVAISKRVNIQAEIINNSNIKIHLQNTNSSEEFNITDNITYDKDKDYFKSSINVLKRLNYEFTKGLDVNVSGYIPIHSKLSSSASLVVAWIKLLTKLNGIDLSPNEIAKLAYRAEMLEFNEPGGKMAHYTTALGGVMFLDFEPQVKIERLSTNLGTFVIGNSGQPKDTKAILANVKIHAEYIANKIKFIDSNFSFRNTALEEFNKYRKYFPRNDFNLLLAAKRNYNITMQAKELFTDEKFYSQKEIGKLLNKEQQILREELNVSTNKINRMIDASLNAGAYGAKINDSSSGCMFAYAPENPEEVAESLRKMGCKAFIVKPDEGVMIHDDSYSLIAS
ncbi:MAG: GHMP kinase [Ignavibacteriae bacterium]|nr:MAG: GHMP kinase [Ignavibacteriota bacterium]